MRPLARVGNAWPTAEQALLLQAALLDGEKARRAWEAWGACVDLQRIDEGSLRLLPLLYRNLTSLGIRSPLMGKLRGVHRQAWYRNQLLLRCTGDVLRNLRAQGIDTLVLMGVPLSLLHYRDEAVRPIADVDVLVPVRDASAALDVLRQSGWTPYRMPPGWPPKHRASCLFVDAWGQELNLHWHVLPDRLADVDFWAGAVDVELGGVATRALNPTDQLLHVLVHGLRWNPVPPVHWVADASAVIRQAGTQLDWERLVAQARKCGVLLTVGSGLEYLKSLPAVSVPATVDQALREHAASSVELLRHWARMRSGIWATGVRVWLDYACSLDGTDRRPGLVGLIRYLRDYWYLETAWRVPMVLANRVVSRIRRRVGPGASGPSLPDRAPASPRPLSPM